MDTNYIRMIDQLIRDLANEDINVVSVAVTELLTRSKSHTERTMLIERRIIPRLVGMFYPKSTSLIEDYFSLLVNLLDSSDSISQCNDLQFGEKVADALLTLDPLVLAGPSNQTPRPASQDSSSSPTLVDRGVALVSADNCIRVLLCLWAGDRNSDLPPDGVVSRSWKSARLIERLISIVDVTILNRMKTSFGNTGSASGHTTGAEVGSGALRLITVLRDHPHCQTNGIATDSCVWMALRVLRSFKPEVDRWRAMSILNYLRTLPKFVTSVCNLTCFCDVRNNESLVPVEHHVIIEKNYRLFFWEGNISTVDTSAIAVAVGGNLKGGKAEATLEEMCGDVYKQDRAAYLKAHSLEITNGSVHLLPSGEFSCIRYVILAVIGTYSENKKVESEKILFEAWKNLMNLLIREKIESITIPLIGAGVAKYPPKLAIETAVTAIREAFRCPDAQQINLKVRILDLNGEALRNYQVSYELTNDRR